MLLAVPNISEGRDGATIDAVADAFAGAPGIRLLDVHRDADHNRSVFTLAGEPGNLAPAVLSGARVAVERIDLRAHAGVHPHVGALDVAPIVHLDAATRGAACAEALVLGDLLARELELPVLLYGALAQGRTRAELRRGGPAELARRIAAGEVAVDFAPRMARAAAAHPTAGTTLVAARPPLVAFNVTLQSPATLEQARAIASRIREGGSEGIAGLRAIGLQLERRRTIQISMNVERPHDAPLAAIVERIRAHAPIAAAELVGLAPRAAFDGFPDDLPIPGFDPVKHTIEHALDQLSS